MSNIYVVVAYILHFIDPRWHMGSECKRDENAWLYNSTEAEKPSHALSHRAKIG